MSIKFEDFSMKCKAELNDVTISFLREAGAEVKSAVQRNTRVDTGQLKGSWHYKTDKSKGEVVIGSTLENALWEEFGTGQYALQGNGRKTPWKYRDRKGNWHKTVGKTPNRALYKAFTSLEGKLKNALENKLKGMG